jgi:hypothetical protein
VCGANIPEGKRGVNFFLNFFLNGISTTDGHGWTRIKTLNLQGILTQRRKEAKAQGVEKEILSSKCNKPLSAECGVRSAESCGVRGHVRALERRDMSRRGKAVTCHRSPRQAAAAVVIHPCASVFIRGSFSPFFLTTDAHGWTRIKQPDLQGILTQRRKGRKGAKNCLLLAP